MTAATTSDSTAAAGWESSVPAPVSAASTARITTRRGSRPSARPSRSASGMPSPCELGVVPPDSDLAPWIDGVPRWDDLEPDAQRAAALLMELYAGFASHADAQVGLKNMVRGRAGAFCGVKTWYTDAQVPP